MIRIVLLLVLGLFIYTRFDSLWSTVREAARPLAVWNKPGPSGTDKTAASTALAWSNDSSRVTVNCPRGLDAACCENLNAVDRGLCGSARSLLENARWRGALKFAREAAAERPQQWDARAVVSDLGDWSYELSGARGRDDAGPYAWRRGAGASWCESKRGCLTPALKPARARAPLSDGRLVSFGNAGAVRGGATVVTWVSSSPRVRAVLPGRVVALEAAGEAPAASEKGATTAARVNVRVYHGAELYATYGPVSAAAGVEPGALVKTGSWLGDLAPTRAGGYVLTMSLRQAGQPADATALWDHAPLPEASLLTALSTESEEHERATR